MPDPLFVGVDPHRKTNVACLMDREGREVTPRFRFENNRPGTARLVQTLVQQMQTGPFDTLRLATEATNWYWWHFFQTLATEPALKSWPLALYAFNPRLTANYKKSLGDLDHTDPIDALVVADRLRLGRDLPAPFRFDERYFGLRLLTRYRYHLIHSLTREKTYGLATLYLKASAYTALEPFADVFGATSRAVLQEFASLDELTTQPFAHVVEFLEVKGKRRFANPEANARTRLQVAADSYRLPDAVCPPVNLRLTSSFQLIASLEAQVKRVDVAIAEALQGRPNTLTPIPGMGPVFVAGLLAEIGGLDRFQGDDAKVAKFAGLKWRQHQSAEFRAQDTPLTQAGNPYLRYDFCEAADTVRHVCPEYQAYYERKYQEALKHQHKRAIVLTARKLVRLVVRLLTTNQPYQPRRSATP
jgi:transposase